MHQMMYLDSDRKQVVEYIEKTFDNIIIETAKRPYGHPKIILQRVDSVDVTFDENQQLVRTIHSRAVQYEWPGTTQEEAWRFACVGKILAQIYSAIISGQTVTKRDIYYYHPSLFKKQATVDRYIDDIAHTCKVTRKSLNVTASPRGLCIGLMSSNEILSISDTSTDALEGVGEHIRWILIVEKEATFNILAASRFHLHASAGLGVVITARGYPDLSTQRFVQVLVRHLEDIVPIFGLFDLDPDGLDILRCYCMGSKSTAAEPMFSLAIRWLGVCFDDVKYEACIPMTARDRMKARFMLPRSHCTESCVQNYRNVLQQMLMLNIKAEIQALERNPAEFVAWLINKMGTVA